MGGVILDSAVIGEPSIVGAQALVKQGLKIPPGSLILGTLAKIIRTLTRRERNRLKSLAAKCAAYAACRLKHGIHVGEPLPAR